jgi:hypothetical protein
MKSRKRFKNSEIYKIAEKLIAYPLEDSAYIPVVFNFYI